MDKQSDEELDHKQKAFLGKISGAIGVQHGVELEGVRRNL